MPNEEYFWRYQLNKLANRSRDVVQDAYFKANQEMIGRAISGLGPDDDAVDVDAVDVDAGIRIVANIPSVHIPDFCEASRDNNNNKPYKNYYDRGQGNHGVGEPPTTRQRVDQSLPITGFENIYFCAIEMNGCGVRFYGDVCLVLKPSASDNNLMVLDRNSYDLVRSPIRELAKGDENTRRGLAGHMSGELGADLQSMVELKVLQGNDTLSRRITIGQISEKICDDEDYIEVLWCSNNGDSFKANDLEHVRCSAADTALENRILAGRSNDTVPDVSEFLWAKHRKAARRALASSGLSWKVVTTAGRVKS